MLPTQLNIVCSALTNINKISLHTDNPGNTGEYDSGVTKQTLTWTTPAAGQMRALATFTNVSGTFTHVGLWDDSDFVHAEPLNVALPTAQTLVVLVEFGVEVPA